MEPKVVIAGYFGCGNLGDDAILAGLLQGLSGLPVRPVVLSGSPERTYRDFGTEAIPRKNLGAVAKALEGAEALILGGGSLFQDVTSAASAVYYSRIVSMGKKSTGRVIMLGQGFGPVRRMVGKWAVAGAVRKADAIAVRDQESLKLVRAFGAQCEVRQTADLAWLAKPEASSAGEGFGMGDQRTVGLVPRGWKQLKPIAVVFSQFARKLSEAGHMPLILPFDEAGDEKLYAEMNKNTDGRLPMLRGIRSPQAMLARVERLHGVVTMRYHGAIFAVMAGIAPILVSYDPKVTYLSEILEVPAAIPFDRLTVDRLANVWEQYEQKRDYYATRMPIIRQNLESKARENISMLCRFVPSLAGEAGARQPGN